MSGTVSGTDFVQANQDILTNHGLALPLLAAGIGAEFFFYTHDLNHKVRYLSESVWDICQVRSEDWVGRLFDEMLTDHAWNKQFFEPTDGRPTDGLPPDCVCSSRCEVWNSQGHRVRLSISRRLIMHNDEPVGVVGMAKAFNEPLRESKAIGAVESTSLRHRLSSLTLREREVIQLVVDGELNKSIAKKLGIAMRTVEARRSKAMSKLGVSRLSDLVRFWIAVKEATDEPSAN